MMEKKLYKLIDCCSGMIKKDGYKEIMHYYNHDEYEMALEGFIIELISSKIRLNEAEKNELVDLARYYRLNIESVFDTDIWSKLLQWVNL